jgi:hypothetical protein
MSRAAATALAMGVVCALLITASASAAVVTPPTLGFSLSRTDGVNTVNWSNDTPGAGSGAENEYFTDVNTENWGFTTTGSANPDPVLTSNLAVTNNTAFVQTFTSTVTLPIANITPSTLRGGSVGGSVTDGTGDGATLATSGGISLYSAQVNLVTAHTLHNDPTSVTAPAFDTATIPAANFGAPIPSLVGGAALNSISIQLRFTLTPGDSAVISSSFVVDPVPEPTGLLALGLLGGLTMLARRRGGA